MTPQATPQPGSPAQADVVLSGRGLSKSYQMGEQSIPALTDVDLTVAAGEFVAVMGPSGSGKSTLLHLLGLLDSPNSGSVEIEGRATGGLSDDELTALRRDELGFLFQNFELIPNLSARENILLPAEVSGRLKEATAGGGSDGNTTSLFTPTLDGLGTTGDGAHANHEFIFLEKLPERTALLSLLLLADPLIKN